MSTSTILEWLHGIPSDCHLDTTTPHATKRRRLNPPTPDASTISCDKDQKNSCVSMPNLRQKSPRKHSEGAGSETPRSKRFRSDIEFDPSETSVPGSGRLSPSKQFHLLRMQPDGILYRDFPQFANKPQSLRTILKSVERAMEGHGIVPSSEQLALLQAAQEYEDEFGWVESGNHYFSDTRDALGQVPSVETVLRILDKAVECSAGSHHEDGWNKFVHAPLLELAFHPTGQRIKDQLISPTSCVNASIIPDYGMLGAAKKVDFCVYVNPSNDSPALPESTPPAVSAIKRLIHQLPGKKFNFTDYDPLEERPIALSIETKKPSEGFDTAKLQLGVWEMAHWSFLKYLRDIQLSAAQMRRLQEEQEPEETGPAQELGAGGHSVQSLPLRERLPITTPTSVAEEFTGPFQLPEFMPGIIIQGHDWHLVFTTFDGTQTKFWQKKPMGSTGETKGIYQIVHNLQILRQWVDKTYWPWLRELILYDG